VDVYLLLFLFKFTKPKNLSMVSEFRKSNNNFKKPSKEFFSKSRRDIERFAIIAFLLLIAAILLIILDQRLLSGCMIIAGTSIGLIIVKKIWALNKIFKESLNEFSSLNEKKDDLITQFSHRIREPLNNLVIIVDMLMESGLQKKQKDLLETFIASTNNMVTSVHELSMNSSSNLSYESREPIKFNLISTFQNTIELYRLKDKANIDFIMDLKEFNNFECFGDPIIFKQIFLDLFNTIENKVSERAIQVQIQIKKVIETGTKTIISFRIQTDKSIVLINDIDAEPSLTARMISATKGSFKQEIGNNSTILTILLPFTNPISAPKTKTTSSKIEELRQKDKVNKELKDLKILLVEDNLINQKITLLTLNPLVKSIDTACNGKEALDMFGTANYDLILMDIQMPIMSGLVASEKIRALESTTNSHIPIIAITANAMIGDKEKCLSAGIDDYISKPFQPAALIEKIKMNI
jgi:CheY-like chemotaxis protein